AVEDVRGEGRTLAEFSGEIAIVRGHRLLLAPDGGTGTGSRVERERERELHTVDRRTVTVEQTALLGQCLGHDLRGGRRGGARRHERQQSDQCSDTLRDS